MRPKKFIKERSKIDLFLIFQESRKKITVQSNTIDNNFQRYLKKYHFRKIKEIKRFYLIFFDRFIIELIYQN